MTHDTCTSIPTQVARDIGRKAELTELVDRIINGSGQGFECLYDDVAQEAGRLWFRPTSDVESQWRGEVVRRGMYDVNNTNEVDSSTTTQKSIDNLIDCSIINSSGSPEHGTASIAHDHTCKFIVTISTRTFDLV